MKKFTQLSYQERRNIYSGLCAQKSRRQIARELDRAPSTISREVSRSSDHIGYLYAGEAQERTDKRKYKNKLKVDKDPALKTYIIKHLRSRWSPKAIAGRWNDAEPEIKITAEAIYQWIYSKEGKSLKLSSFLLRTHKKRGLRRKPEKTPKIRNRVSIHDRPEVINQRLEPWHWECDLIFHKGSQSKNALTFIERVSRTTIIIKNDNKTTDAVITALIVKIKDLGLIVKSITFDSGSEFAGHERLNELGVETYFCDPGSPWQKGSIENMNGLIRRVLPFKMRHDQISQQDCDEAAQRLNDMPRAILNYKTASEAFKEMMHV